MPCCVSLIANEDAEGEAEPFTQWGNWHSVVHGTVEQWSEPLSLLLKVLVSRHTGICFSLLSELC